MRASPAFQITVRHFGVWRGVLLSLLVFALMVWAAWLASPQTGSSLLWRAGATAVVACLLVMVASLLHCSPFSLRWDGQQWHFGPASSLGEEPCQGRLVVALDMGAWMLLKFVTLNHSSGRRIRWLALQRRGLETQWHALRCAVYCARFKPMGDADPLVASAQEFQE